MIVTDRLKSYPGALRALKREGELYPDIARMGSVRGDTAFLGQTIGKMRPDLIAIYPLSGQALVFDLVPKRSNPHLKKTMFYERLLSHCTDVSMGRVAEVYYNDALR